MGVQREVGRWLPSKAKYLPETDITQVPRGKGEKDFEKRVKQSPKLRRWKPMFTAQAEGAARAALRCWDTVTLWGELSANKGCATRLRVRRAPGRNQKREGEGPRGLQGGHALSPSRATRPAPFPASSPFRGVRPPRMSVSPRSVGNASAPSGAEGLQEEQGAGGRGGGEATPPPFIRARRPNMAPPGLVGRRRAG